MTRYLVLIITLLGLAGCSRIPASPVPSKQSAIPAGKIGSQLPEFNAKDLKGNDVSSQDLRGKVVLIDFWATWCQPCEKEMPGYQKLLDQYASRGFAVIGFKFDTMMDTENPLQFASKIGVHYPLAVASEKIKNKFGGIEGLPTTLLYDRQGILRDKVIGFEYNAHFEQELKSLL